ncbi:hypothetical protein [Rhodanobacter denitrificans]|uniref:hypothetical protein n=1 Tax=Rhodanobacter denitrificans TaxID=666685 RepID=UPI001F261BEC|nr:hypothetical protein [Rhodanobacter denitrificans]UJJ60643.1 hypothetical protein LRK55_19605 [Rhodanobacter denitrificans]
MNFAHEPLTDAAADTELRALLRSPDCRILRVGGFRQKVIAQSMMFIGAVVALAAWFNNATHLAAVAGLLAVAGVTWTAIVAVHEEYAERWRAKITSEFAEAHDCDLKYLLEMKEKYHEIDAAIRDWTVKGLTIRERDVRAVRAWVFKVEPVRERDRLLRQLQS